MYRRVVEIGEGGAFAREADRQWVTDLLKSRAGDRVEIIIRSPPRTTEQNRYYRHVLARIAEELQGAEEYSAIPQSGLVPDYSPEGLHKAFRRAYLPQRATRTSTRRGSTTVLTRQEFHWYLQRVLQDSRVAQLDLGLEEVPLIEDEGYICEEQEDT